MDDLDQYIAEQIKKNPHFLSVYKTALENRQIEDNLVKLQTKETPQEL